MLNLGGLFFTLNADTSGLVNAQRQIEQFAQRVTAAFQGVGRGTVDPGFANQMNRQEQAMLRVMDRVKQLQASVQNINLTPKGAAEAQAVLQRVGQAFEQFTQKLSQGALNPNVFQRQFSRMTSVLNDAQRGITALGRTASIAPEAGGWNKFTNAIMGLGSASLLVQGHFGGFSTRFFGFAGLMREFTPLVALGTAALVGFGAALVALGEHAVHVGVQLQTIQLGFRAVSNSSAEAAHDLKFAHDLAMQAGTSFTHLAESYVRYVAAAQTGGLTLKQTEDSFKGLTLAAATVGLSTEKMNNVFLALQEMLSKGIVTTQQLRRQLATEIPGAVGIAANALGVTQSKLEDLVRKGLVPAAEFVQKFVAQLEKQWHINADKNIETLRASIGRLENQWTDLGIAVGRQTTVLTSFASTLDKVSGFLKFIQNNMATLVPIIGAVTGAVVGLGLAWLAWMAYANIGVIGSLFAKIASGAIAFVQLATEVRSAAGAFALLDAAIAPTLGLIGLIALLVAAIGGATIGYGLFKKAMADTSDVTNQQLGIIEQYIKNSEAQGTQIKVVTNDLMDQTKALLANATAQADAADAALAAAGARPTTTDYLGSFASDIDVSTQQLANAFSGAGGKAGHAATPQEEHAKALKVLKDSADAAHAAVTRLQADMKGLQQVSTLKDQTATPIEPLTKAAKGLDAIVNKVKDLMDAAKGAEEALNVMFAAAEGGKSFAQATEMGKLAEDAAKAREITNNLKPAQLAAAAATLHVADSVGAVNAALTTLITTTRHAKEITEEFTKAWGGIDKAQIELKDLTTTFNTLLASGDNPHQLRFLENFQKAQEQLRILQEQADAGDATAAKALENLTRILAENGIQAKDAATGWAILNTKIDETKEGIKILTEMSVKFRDLENQVSQTATEFNRLSSGFGNLSGIQGSFANFAFGADLDKSLQEAITRGQQVLALREQMAALPDIFNPQQIDAYSNAFLVMLRNLDAYKEKLAEAQVIAQRNQEAFKGFVDGALQGLEDFLNGTKNLKTALLDLAKTFTDIAYKDFVVGPINDWLTKLGKSMSNKATAGVDTNVADNASNALTDLAGAAGAASDATKNQLAKSIQSIFTGQTSQAQASIKASVGLVEVANAATEAAAALHQLGGGGLLSKDQSLGGIDFNKQGGFNLGQATDFSGLGKVFGGGVDFTNTPLLGDTSSWTSAFDNLKTDFTDVFSGGSSSFGNIFSQGANSFSNIFNGFANSFASILGGITGGGGGGGGLLSILGSVVGSLFGGGAGLGGMMDFSGSFGAISSGFDFSSIAVAGFGAQGIGVQAGKAYRINEIGVEGGEYFIPRDAGDIVPASKMGAGGGKTIVIDASTTIDARGATQDAIALLKAEMAVRQDELERRIPLMVDNRVLDSSKRGRYS